YKGALEAGLPIGSGEIESAHRYVTQERLKIAGAWWKEANAQNMLGLRTLRANNKWDQYWESFYKKAA
ncbi:MAG: ISKra4 family transposase, partial [Deltaproteobacteria bacterium]